MSTLSFQNADPAHTGFQYLEDLATAYWYSEVLFTSIKLHLFDHLQGDSENIESLSHKTKCEGNVLLRLLRVLKKLELIGESKGQWYNSQAAGKYLVSTSEFYLGEFLLYRQYIKNGWETLFERITGNIDTSSQTHAKDKNEAQDYVLRNERYVRTMDALACEKAQEIVSIIPHDSWHPPVLDIGGGAGALCRTMLRFKSSGNAYLFDLPEVIKAARNIYATDDAWQNIQTISGDFRNYEFLRSQKFGLILLGNFLHAYGPEEACRLLKKAVSLLLPNGLIVVHDYFPDVHHPNASHKGAFYDLNMMLNTYDGVCHNAEDISKWLKDFGMTTLWQKHLTTDTSLILAAGPEGKLALQNEDHWPQIAHSLGFRKVVEISTEKIVVASWVQEKCRSGCTYYGQKLQCPPHCISYKETQKLLDSYTRALLVEDVPPSKTFHEKLLALERKAFLNGLHKVLAFGAGPCPVCDACPKDGTCRRPEKSRPSMEGAGIDVYMTAHNGGLFIQPVKNKGDYVKYFGLLLLE